MKSKVLAVIIALRGGALFGCVLTHHGQCKSEKNGEGKVGGDYSHDLAPVRGRVSQTHWRGFCHLDHAQTT